MSQQTPPRIRKFPTDKQRLMDELLDKSSEGTISPTEKVTLNELVAEAEGLMIENAKRLAAFAREGGARPPAGAVPVTVWVHPQTAKR